MNRKDSVQLAKIITEEMEYEASMGVVSYEWLLATLVGVKI